MNNHILFSSIIILISVTHASIFGNYGYLDFIGNLVKEDTA